MTSTNTLIREWRGTVSQAVAASSLGVSLRTYQAWEQGRKMDASVEALLRLVIRFVKPA